jgi:cycloeucalenol cycloisomerase
LKILGNDFISEYFFDVLGMIYNYPNLEINLDSPLVGSGEQSVPLIMYPMTMATYMTYHTTSIIAMRRTMTSRLGSGRWSKWLLFLVVVLALAYF